ncbi:AMP-binding protein [Streptomyces sp. NPDC051940]|uniref:AMP-binding protein n=1 Tax=Streptomyces sp. NPDC051940 TaxID=3155675 RepID=UPI00343AA7F8
MTAYDEFPASAQQKAIWFVERLAPGSARYHVPAAVELTGPLDVEALEAALRAVVRRHESLRTGFAAADGEPVQRVYAEGQVVLTHEDCPTSGAADAAERRLALEPFDLAGPSLLRAGLLRLGEGRHRLVVVAHHLVCDAWSDMIVIRDLAAAYAGRELPPGPIDYADYAVWQEQTLTPDVVASYTDAWRAELLPFAEPLALPVDRPRPALRGEGGGSLDVALPAGGTFAGLLAAIAAALHRLTGQPEVVLGTVAAQRDRPELAGLVGCLVNTLPVRIPVTAADTLGELRARVQETLLRVQERRDLPYDRLVEALRPPREPSRLPLTDVLVTWAPEPPPLGLPGVGAELRRIPTATAKADLSVEASGDSAHLEYATDVVGAETAEWFGRALGRFLGAAPQLAVADVDLLAEGEAERLAALGRGPAVTEPPATVVQRFAEVVRRFGDRPAVDAPDGRLTYAELADAVRACAAALVEDGVRPGDRVGVRIGAGRDWPVAMLGGMHAGAAVVPIDPGYPQDRIDFMVEASGAKAVLTDVRKAGTAELPEVAPGDLAYTVFTSGSTGRPKGVAVEHASFVRMADATVARFGLGPGDRVLRFASPAFDAAMWDLVLALLSGATLCLAEPTALVPGPILRDTLRGRRVSYVLVPPSALALVPHEQPLPDLRVLVSGGEACTAELVARWSAGRRFVNAYGPTEGTVVATLWEASGTAGEPPLGEPLPGVRVHVLDAGGQPAPPGVPGELVLGGDNLARGYLGRDDLTAEVFRNGRDGRRVYRTGDRAVRRGSGELVYLGRVDDQVKIRGFRVEPAEAEHALRALPGVRAAAVVARGTRTGTELVGYFVPDDDPAPAPGEVRAALARTLPGYLVPAHLVALADLPVTASGKLDRAALPDPVPVTGGGRMPRGDTETRIARVWCDVLGLDRVGATDNFFDVGGHSLALAQVHARLTAELGRDFPIVEMFSHPTVELLAEQLSEPAGRPTAAQSGRDQAAKRLAMRRGRGA